jgi:hypothetical protein
VVRPASTVETVGAGLGRAHETPGVEGWSRQVITDHLCATCAGVP